jgi:hypothetical protein
MAVFGRLSMELQGRSRHTIPINRAMTHVPSAQPSAMKNPHTNQTSNALAEIIGTIGRPPFDQYLPPGRDGLNYRNIRPVHLRVFVPGFFQSLLQLRHLLLQLHHLLPQLFRFLGDLRFLFVLGHFMHCSGSNATAGCDLSRPAAIVAPRSTRRARRQADSRRRRGDFAAMRVDSLPDEANASAKS